MEKNILSKLVPSDYLSFIICIIGVIISIYASLKAENIWIGLVSAIVSQVLAVCAWIYAIIIRYSKDNELERKNSEIANILSTNENKVADFNAKIEECAEKRKEILEQLVSISTAVKSHNIHNNDILLKIPQEGDEQYDFIAEYYELPPEEQDLDDEMREEIQKSAQKYADALFSIFNRYCRDSTDDTKKLQTAYLKLKGCPRRVSVTIKLFDKPYHPKTDRNEDIKVYTAFRDNDTYNDNVREIGEIIYSIGKNTDFIQCLKQDYFITNNITSDAKNYMNENKAFSRFYNCAVVIPIRLKRPNGDLKFFGFFCCECLNNDTKTEIFDKISANYLFAFGQNMATFLETLDNNWIDRYEQCHIDTDNILKMLFIKIFKNDEVK